MSRRPRVALPDRSPRTSFHTPGPRVPRSRPAPPRPRATRKHRNERFPADRCLQRPTPLAQRRPIATRPANRQRPWPRNSRRRWAARRRSRRPPNPLPAVGHTEAVRHRSCPCRRPAPIRTRVRPPIGPGVHLPVHTGVGVSAPAVPQAGVDATVHPGIGRGTRIGPSLIRFRASGPECEHQPQSHAKTQGPLDEATQKQERSRIFGRFRSDWPPTLARFPPRFSDRGRAESRSGRVTGCPRRDLDRFASVERAEKYS